MHEKCFNSHRALILFSSLCALPIYIHISRRLIPCNNAAKKTWDFIVFFVVLPIYIRLRHQDKQSDCDFNLDYLNLKCVVQGVSLAILMEINCQLYRRIGIKYISYALIQVELFLSSTYILASHFTLSYLNDMYESMNNWAFYHHSPHQHRFITQSQRIKRFDNKLFPWIWFACFISHSCLKWK